MLDDLLYDFAIFILVLIVILIIITLIMLPVVGDENTQELKRKAQSFTLIIMIMTLIVEAARELYSVFWGYELYERRSPIALLGSTAVIYLVSLSILRRKYRKLNAPKK